MEEDVADEMDAAAATAIHLQTTWQMSAMGMGNKCPNLVAILASRERQSPRPCSHSNSRALQTFPIYTRGITNWNMCYSCGFDIEDGHTSMTCMFWKVSHQTGFTRENAQQYIAAGHVPCTKGMHKSILSTKQYT
jgi:hypothetical protein